MARIWTPNPDCPTLHLPQQHGASIEVGRRTDHGGRVWPHARSEKWGGECWLEVAARGVIPRPGKPERLLAGGEILEIDCDRPAGRGRAKGETHRLRHGSLKWEVIYGESSDLPDDGYAAFDLSSPPGLSFHHQPALTQQEIDDGAIRPDNVIGSYAAYWPATGRIVRPDGSEIVNYATGKYCHIYRPKWVAANGEWAWGEQAIIGTELRITIPAAWIESLGSAAFPLTLDPTFGYDSIGASSISYNNLSLIGSGPYPAGADGNVTAVSVATYDDSVGFTCGLYANGSTVPAARLGQGSGGTSTAGQWFADTLTSPVAVSAGTNYWPALGKSQNSRLYYDSTNSEVYAKGQNSYSYSQGALPDPFGTATYSNQTYGRISIYATIESAATPTRALVIGGGVI